MKLFIFFFLAFASFAQAQHVIIGRDVLPINGEIVTDTFLFFDENKIAFRGGLLDDSQKWAPDSIGLASFAYGGNVKASGVLSFAVGFSTIASGDGSFASGDRTQASGYFSNASGTGTVASGVYSLASGFGSVASGITSFASGESTNASGGISFTSGGFTTASGSYSFAAGGRTIAPSFCEFSIGIYNTEYTPIATADWNADDRLFVIGNGTSDVLRSDAMVVKKNGDVSFPDGNFIVGRDAVPSNGETVTDGMLFYDDAKYALRGGLLNSSKNWAPDSIGTGSFAYGYNTKAFGIYSFAFGEFTTASGADSFASGLRTKASGGFSFASGSSTKASGSSSFSSGSSTTASGNSSFSSGSLTTASGLISFASGSGTTASGLNSFASGSGTKASGAYSFASGRGSQASGDYSFSSGSINIASGDYSFAAGQRTFAPSYAEFSIGSYNTDYTPNDTEAWNANDRLFVIGNGTDLLRSDAMVVLKNGNTSINGNMNIKGESTIEAVNSTSDAILYTKSGTSPATRVILHQKTTEDIFIGDLDGRGGNLRLRSNGEDRLVITPAGNIAVKNGDLITNTSTNNLGRSGNCWNQAFLINGINDCSDQRLKKNIVNLDYGLATIAALRPVSYEWKENNVGIKLGLIAQEVKEIVPEVVHIPENPEEFMSINYTELIPVLIKSIQEQQVLIEELKDELLNIRAELDRNQE